MHRIQLEKKRQNKIHEIQLQMFEQTQVCNVQTTENASIECIFVFIVTSLMYSPHQVYFNSTHYNM